MHRSYSTVIHFHKLFIILDEMDNNFGSRPDLTKYVDIPIPEWVVIGESVLIRPYNSSGVVAYIGGTDFAAGTWIGVELDAPKGNYLNNRATRARSVQHIY